MLEEASQVATIFACVFTGLIYFDLVPAKLATKFAATGASIQPRSKIILLLMICTWAWCGLTTYRLHSRSHFNDDKSTLILMRGKTFANQVVVLDGFDYEDCHFQNVTFSYNGTSLVSFNHNTIVGSPRIMTGSPGILSFATLLKGMGMLIGDLGLTGPEGQIPYSGAEPPEIHRP